MAQIQKIQNDRLKNLFGSVGQKPDVGINKSSASLTRIKKDLFKKSPATLTRKELTKLTKKSTIPSQLNLAIAFDTTGSMSHLLRTVKKGVSKILEEVLEFSPFANICIIPYKDYDSKSPWPAKASPLTNDMGSLSKFLREVNIIDGQGGSNDGEAVEAAMHEANKLFATKPNTNKVLIVIGDQAANGYRHKSEKVEYDYGRELLALKKEGVTIYTIGMQGGEWDSGSKKFFELLSEKTGGEFFFMDDLGKLISIILSTAAKSSGLDELSEFYLEGGSLLELPISKRKALCAPK